MTTRLLLFLSLLMGSYSIFAQDDVDLSISSKDTAALNIIKVLPNEFPNLSIVFNAETYSGHPIWNLQQEQIQIFEGEQACPIHYLKRISEEQSVNIGLVVDHSGSMYTDHAQLFDKNGKFLGSYNAYGQLIPPKGYKTPLENAKAAVLSFMETLDNDKDSIQLVGFDDKVDRIRDFSNDLKPIRRQISKMEPTGLTALYDAIKVSLENIQKQGGIKVIIALSDGNDNRSKSTVDEIIQLANQLEVPIYTIGLGSADQKVLQQISDETDGAFFYTKSSNSLTKIYDKIAKQILSIYELGYRSENLSSDANRDFKLVFDIDSLYLTNNDIAINLPTEVVEHLKQKEAEAAQQLRIYAGMGIAGILLAGSLIFLFAKRRAQKEEEPAAQILKTYPNPFDSEITVEYQLSSTLAHLIVRSIDGSIVHSQPIDNAANSAILSVPHFQKGTYLLSIQTENGTSNIEKIVKI